MVEDYKTGQAVLEEYLKGLARLLADEVLEETAEKISELDWIFKEEVERRANGKE